MNDGATYVIRGTVGTDATNSGNVSLILSPGEGEEFEVLYGEVSHDDAARTILVEIDDGTNQLARIAGASDTVVRFPHTGDSAMVSATRLMVSGSMRLVLSVAALAVSKTATFRVTLRVRSDIPQTRTFAGPTGATLTTTTSRIF